MPSSLNITVHVQEPLARKLSSSWAVSTENRDLRAMPPLDVRILSAPAYGISYSSVFTKLEQMDETLAKVWDHAQMSECLIDGVEWVGDKMTILNLMLCDEELGLFGTTETTTAFVVKNSVECFSKNVVELCAGTGSMGIGPIFLGATLCASVENNHLACRHLSLNNHGAIFERSLDDPSLTLELRNAIGSVPATFTLGFPCQPFSMQGSQLRQLDQALAPFGRHFELCS